MLFAPTNLSQYSEFLWLNAEISSSPTSNGYVRAVNLIAIVFNTFSGKDFHKIYDFAHVYVENNTIWQEKT